MAKLKNLQRNRLGILTFNMYEANDEIRSKLTEFSTKLGDSIKELRKELQLYFTENLNQTKSKFNEMRSHD